MMRYSAELSTGEAAVEIYSSVMDPSALFGFAERANPKRSFLFVSRVLGRHIPVRPSLMRETYDRLVAGLPPDLPGPVLVIGMAETAIGLGGGVQDSYRRTTGRRDVLYLPSTRHPMGGPLMAEFREEHSHATQHMIHWPVRPDYRAMVESARTVILVDDEISSGNTFRNLADALLSAGLAPTDIACVCLTDWSNRQIAPVMAEVFPTAQFHHSVLSEGRYFWTPDPDASLPSLPTPDVAAAGIYPLPESRDWGRLGVIQSSVDLEAQAVPGRKTLVLGSSEFVWQPFLLAERLEVSGEDVRFSSVTRSPVFEGYAIESKLEFTDNYGLGIPNYLYNVSREKYDRILLCIETPPSSVDPTLIAALSPEILTTA